jgi:DNA replication licensing factor MCM4
MSTPNRPPRSSSPLAFPSSSAAGTPRAQRNGNRVSPAQYLVVNETDDLAPATSSPLHFPTSSPAGSGRRGQAAARPLASQSSTAGHVDSTPGQGRRVVRERGQTPLFLPG